MNRHTFRNWITGFSVAGLILPEAIAYAGIAGLQPGRALLAAITGGLAYALLGQSRFAIVSPTSSSAAILAAAIAGLPGDSAAREGMATAMVAIVGVMFLGLSAFRLGSLAGFISRPVLRGFAFGLAVTIIVRQLPKLLGIAVQPGSIWTVVPDLVLHVREWHLVCLALGLAALAILLAMRRFPAVPTALLVILGGIALGQFVDLAKLGVATAGTVTLGLPELVVPRSFALWANLVQLAAPIALMIFAESWGTMRNLALKHGDPLSANRELGALGAANIASALVQGMPVGAGFSAGNANEAAGATSRMAGGGASLALLILALFAAPWIARIPEPVLAAVVIAALTHAISPAAMMRLFRIGRDQWIGVAAAGGVLVFGVLNGMLVAVGLSIATLLYTLAHPTISELGRVGGSHDFVDMLRHRDAVAPRGIVLLRPNAPLMFANAESVLQVIARRALSRDAGTVVLSLEESNDLDSTAIEALGEFAGTLAKAGKRLILARAHDRVRDVLTAAGMDDLARHSTYSVADAAERAAKGN